MKNTGGPSEEFFDKAHLLYGKRAHVFTFTDAARATGMNGKRVYIECQPSDRLVTIDGIIHYAEVKSTVTEVERFEFKLLKKTQRAFATQILTAGGPYFVYMHFVLSNEWFKIPYKMIEYYKDLGKSSIPKSVLIEKGLQWNFPTTIFSAI